VNLALTDSSPPAKPFLKWAGGKTQLLEQIRSHLPQSLYQRDFTYIEPFVGSGAVLLWMLRAFPNIKKAVIADINQDLIQTWKNIARTPLAIIGILQTLQNEYYAIERNEVQKKEYYYAKRALFNARTSDSLTQSALLLFLNRTCFNGLYRVNRSNEYNVPIGSYKRPMICDAQNILAVSELLGKVEIICVDFEKTLKYAEENSFFYLDPPYKPLNETSSFTAYAANKFNDAEQIRLHRFCQKLNEYGCQWLLSNSDHHFFDNIYSHFQRQRVIARRSINSNPSKRGELTELLIKNC